MSEAKYNLVPLYKPTSDEEIALEDLSAVPAPKETSDEKKTDSCCSKKNSCSKDGKKRSVCARISRCVAMTMLVGMCLWMITGLAMVTYMGAKVHRCLHPRHVAQEEFTWAPSSLPALELGVVSGSLNVRSCPRAKNVTLTVRTYAGTEDLLNTMVIQRDAVTAGGERIVLLAPSFDWAHCQRAVFDLVVPEGANLDIKAQGILGRIDVRAAKNAVRNLIVSANVAHVDVHGSELAGLFRVDAEIALVRARDVTATEVCTDIRAGHVELRGVESTSSIRSTVRIGCASFSHVTAATELVHSSELGWVKFWDTTTPAITARVDYGSLFVAVPNDFAGKFAARSPYGFLKLNHGTTVAPRVTLAQETPAIIEGSVQAESASAVAPKSVSLDALYGSVTLFVPDPETNWERSHHRRP
jgi:hypothetical protein